MVLSDSHITVNGGYMCGIMMGNAPGVRIFHASSRHLLIVFSTGNMWAMYRSKRRCLCYDVLGICRIFIYSVYTHWIICR